MADHHDLSAQTSGDLSPARTKPPSLRDIAAYLDLSPATVSMVLNDVPLAKSLSKETRARVLEATRIFNYRPNLVARALSKRESRTVGVIAPESSDGYFTRVMRGVEEALLEAGYLYFTASHLGREDLVREYPAALLQRGVDGLIFLNTRIHENPGVPAVSISDKCSLQNVTSVLADQREGMDTAMQHLYDLGHRRILLMRGERWSLDADDRYSSMVAAAERLGLSTAPELQMTLETNQLTPGIAYQAFRQRLAEDDDFTAVFCFNDIAAIGALRAMADAGLSCPEHISVLGVDDIGSAAFLLPRLTTAAQPLEKMGAMAVQHLLARLQQPGAIHAPRVILPMRLEIRESTGMAPFLRERRSPTPGAQALAFQAH